MTTPAEVGADRRSRQRIAPVHITDYADPQFGPDVAAMIEAAKPLAAYRAEELAHMRRNFYGFDPSYHVARHYFVHRKPHAWTPRHLATHRK